MSSSKSGSSSSGSKSKMKEALSTFEETIRQNDEHGNESGMYLTNVLTKKSSSSRSSSKNKDSSSSRSRRSLASLGMEDVPKKEGTNSSTFTESTAGSTASGRGTEEGSTWSEEDNAKFDDFTFEDDDWDPKVSTSRRTKKAPLRRRRGNERSHSDSGERGSMARQPSSRSVQSEGDMSMISNDSLSMFSLEDLPEEHAAEMSEFDNSLGSCSIVSNFERGPVRGPVRNRRASLDNYESSVSRSGRHPRLSRKVVDGSSRRASLDSALTSSRRVTRSAPGAAAAAASVVAPANDEYINSLPPAFQVSERRRLSQKASGGNGSSRRTRSVAGQELFDPFDDTQPE